MTINELIKELKITDIKHAKLKDVCEFERGNTVNKNLLEEGNIPVISSGIEPISFTKVANQNAGVITIATSGSGAGKNNFFGINQSMHLIV